MYFRYLFFAFFLFLNIPSKALNYYWVGSSGKWSEFTSHWATTSGGSTFYTQVPSPFDNVIFDANSFSSVKDSVELDQTIITCNSLTFSTGTEIINLYGGTLASSVNIYGSLSLAPGMVIDYDGKIIFKSNVAGNTIKQNGAIFSTLASYTRGVIEFNGLGSWTVLDSLNLFKIFVTRGTLNVQGKKIYCSEFFSNESNTRSLNFINARISIGFKFIINSDSLTSDFSGSRIEMIHGVFHSYPSAVNYDTIDFVNDPYAEIELVGHVNRLEFKPQIQQIRLADNMVVEDFSSFATYVTCYSMVYLKKSSFKNIKSLDIINTLQLDVTDLSGTDCRNFLTIFSSQDYANIIKTSGQLNLAYAILSGVVSGGGATFNATQSIDLGGNTGWNFSLYSQAKMYWIGGDGDWSDGTQWSFTSGGPPANCVPSPYNDAVFDSHSFTADGQTVTIPDNSPCKSFDCTSSPYKPLFQGILNIYGSILLRPDLDLSGMSNTYFLSGNPGNFIDYSNNRIQGRVIFAGSGGWTLKDSIYAGNIVLELGSLYTNGKKVTCTDFDSESNVAGSRLLDLGSSRVVITQGLFHISQIYPFTLLAGTSVIDIYGGQYASFTNLNFGYNLTYHNLNIYCGNNPTISGDNLIFNKVNYASSVVVQGNIIYDSLYLGEGNGLTIGNGLTQTVNQIIINHSKCLSTNIASLNGGHSIISKPFGTLNLDYITLQNIEATGGAVFNANHCNDLGGNTGWNMTPSLAITYYWIGGEGNWSDLNHWSYTSGGPPAACIPDFGSSVIFDEKSFFSPSQTVHLDLSSVLCGSMTWKNLIMPAILSGTSLTIGKGLHLHNMLSIQLTTLNFSSAVSCTITTAGVMLPDVHLYGKGSYSFEDDLSCVNFTVNSGDTIHANHHNFYAYNFQVDNAGLLNLDLDSANIFIQDNTVFNNGKDVNVISYGANAYCPGNTLITGGRDQNNNLWTFPFNTLHATNNCINGPGSCFYYFMGQSVYFKQVVVDSVENIVFLNGDCYMNEFLSVADIMTFTGAGNSMGSAVFSSTVAIVQNDFTFDRLKIDPGKTLKIEAGQTVFIQDELEAPGNSAFPVSILSTVSGTQANISKASGVACFDYLYISNINATGGATFIAGTHSSDVANNSGWDFLSACTPLIATYDNLICEGGTIYLHATSTGASYQWTGPNGFSSSMQDPVIHNAGLSSSGIYQVSSGGKTAIVYVSIIPLPLNHIMFYPLINTVIETADNKATQTQWFHDGVQLPNIGTFINTNGPGKYYAIVINSAGCQVNSDTLIVYDLTILVPVAPVDLHALAVSGSQINLTWTDLSIDETGFIIERSLDPNTGFVNIGTVAANTTTFSDLGLADNTTYYYRIVAFNQGGPSFYSNTDHATTLHNNIQGEVYVPNLITPNGDGLNDLLKINNLPSDHSLVICNEWGVKIYETRKYHHDWGNEIKPGLYFFRLSYQSKEQKGWISVVR